MLETNYCKAAHPKLDGLLPWSMKPTNILLFGAEKNLKLPISNFDCNYRFPATPENNFKGLHKHAIRIDEKSCKGQTKAEGGMRYAIPRGLFHTIFESHERMLCAQEAQKKGSKVVACEHCMMLIAQNLKIKAPKLGKKSITKTPMQQRLLTARRAWYDLHCKHLSFKS